MPQQFCIYTSKRQTLKQKRTHRQSCQVLWCMPHPSVQKAEQSYRTRACLRGKFTTALLLAKGWGKHKCLANKWISNMCYIQTTKCYSDVWGKGWRGWTDGSVVKHICCSDRESIQFPALASECPQMSVTPAPGETTFSFVLYEHPYMRAKKQ